MCYHIVERRSSMWTKPALKRCFRTRKTAETVRRRGAKGDRSDYYLDATRNLSVVACYDDDCECARWPEGHAAGELPKRTPGPRIACVGCGKLRREAVEMTYPGGQSPALLCRRCAGEAALDYLRKSTPHVVRRVHADDVDISQLAAVR